MTWTTHKPTQPGWYWFKPKNGEALIYTVYITGTKARVLSFGRFFDAPYGDWAGPLEPPR